MSIDVRTIESKKDLKRFVKFPFKIYKGSANWVPLMIMDDMEVFSPKKNPAHERADSRLFLAYKDGKPVGRIVGIISRVANEKYQTRNIRFGWFEAINDYEVAEALFKAVENWGKENGMETVTGPLGYTDLDPEGMLIEGFDELPTIASNYNHPYYQELLEKYGFEKEIDYIEFKAKIPSEDEIPAKLLRLADRIKQRGSLKVLEFKRKRHMMRRGEELFYLLDEAFDEIYGSVPLSDKQIKYYVNKYIFYVHKDLLKAITNEKDEMVGFMIAMPSLSRAFQKAKGRLFPFGWYHLLKALKTYETLDFYLAGVKKKYRGIGVDLLMVIEVAKSAHRMGFKYSESNLELETNTKIHGLWKYFNPTQHKRRRIFKKRIA
jgi:hypothetical protein